MTDNIKLEIYSSPNRDGKTTNITIMYPQGETIHLQTIKTRNEQKIREMKDAFTQAAERIIICTGETGIHFDDGTLDRWFHPHETHIIQEHIKSSLMRLTAQ